jgi:hypothetical protein
MEGCFGMEVDRGWHSGFQEDSTPPELAFRRVSALLSENSTVGCKKTVLSFPSISHGNGVSPSPLFVNQTEVCPGLFRLRYDQFDLWSGAKKGRGHISLWF